MNDDKEGAILKEINRACCTYTAQTGRKPTRIYLGHHERLGMARCAYQMHVIGNEPQPAEIMGMQVFEVCEDNHIYVC